VRRTLKRVLSPLARNRYARRLFRIARTTWRGPEIFVRLNLAEQQLASAREHSDQLSATIETMNAGAAANFERLFEVTTAVHSRQVEIDLDRDYLAKSVPVALRRLQRSQASADATADALSDTVSDLSSALLAAEAALSSKVDEVRGTVSSLSSSMLAAEAALSSKVDEVRGTVSSLSSSMLAAEAAAREAQASEGRWSATDARSAAVEGRVDEHAGTLTYLLERVEFIRSELLFEIRYRDAPMDASPAVETKINVDLDSYGAVLRLNLGSGHIPLPGYVNVDNRDLPGVDVVADVENMPFEEGTVGEIFSSHFLEHFPQEKFTRVLLPKFRSLLAKGGMFRAVVPDVDAMMRQYVAGDYEYGKLREVVYGGQDYDGDFHYNMFTPESLTEILLRAGFQTPRIIDRARRNGMSLEFEIEATNV
jgi:predicted SAM-dependent methyltransferase